MARAGNLVLVALVAFNSLPELGELFFASQHAVWSVLYSSGDVDLTTEVFVVDKFSRKPIDGARVRATDGGSKVFFSGLTEDGMISIPGNKLKSGSRYTIAVSCAGYDRVSLDDQSPGERIKVELTFRGTK